MIKIYKIIDNTNGNVYIGKTKQKLYIRLNNHKQDFKRGSTSMSREIIKNGDYKIELIEETDDKTRERYWIENTECINKNIPGRTDDECKKIWRDNNKQYFKDYRKKNKEYTRIKNKEHSKIRDKWYTSMGGSPYKNNMSLMKIDPNLFLI